jgi:hypothetical protein
VRKNVHDVISCAILLLHSYDAADRQTNNLHQLRADQRDKFHPFLRLLHSTFSMQHLVHRAQPRIGMLVKLQPQSMLGNGSQ